MSTGEGILWATIILIVSAGLFFVTKKSKWRLIGKIFSVLVLLGLLVWSGVFLYLKFQERPRIQNSLFDIELGMLPVDVKLILGKPILEKERDNLETNEKELLFLYTEYPWDKINDADKYIRFTKQNSEYRAYSICESEISYVGILGINNYSTEDEVVKILGQPSNESINSDGLLKILTFGEWNISFVFEKNKVKSFCVTNDDEVTFIDEYEE